MTSNQITSSFDEDSYSEEALEEAIENGEVGYCEVGDHYDWADNIHGHALLHDETDALSFCDDCEPKAIDKVVERSVGTLIDHDTALKRVEMYVAARLYDAETAARLVVEIESHRQDESRKSEARKEDERIERGEFRLGPLLQTEAVRIATAARAEFGKKITAEDVDSEWLMGEINISMDEAGVMAVISDTPDALAYQLDFDELFSEYHTEAATPGWMIGEAAWKLVRDEARKQLGFSSLYEPRAD